MIVMFNARIVCTYTGCIREDYHPVNTYSVYTIVSFYLREC